MGVGNCLARDVPSVRGGGDPPDEVGIRGDPAGGNVREGTSEVLIKPLMKWVPGDVPGRHATGSRLAGGPACLVRPATPRPAVSCSSSGPTAPTTAIEPAGRCGRWASSSRSSAVATIPPGSSPPAPLGRRAHQCPDHPTPPLRMRLRTTPQPARRHGRMGRHHHDDPVARKDDPGLYQGLETASVLNF